MARNKKVKWEEGVVFAIPIEGCERIAIGQVLDNYHTNVIRIAIFDEQIDTASGIELESLCNKVNLISAVECTREQLDYGIWKILGNKTTRPIPFSKYPNEQFRTNQWIGAKTYDAALVEDFVKSFYGHEYWDYYDSNYFDNFLIDKSKKPKNLKFKKRDN